METPFSYNFPALRGCQAGNEYYTIMCPLRLIPKIFRFNEEEIPPEHRAQRVLNRSRIPDITNYILNYPNDYVFSSLTASIDGDIKFEPYSSELNFNDIGNLSVSLDARFLINDGQHRKAAIEDALKISPELGNETISVVFFRDIGLVKSQQTFADLNRHAVNTTSSLGILYDHRDGLAQITKQIISEIPLFVRFTDLEKQNLPKLSPRFLTLSSIFNTNTKILGKKKGDLVSDKEKKFLKEFWQEFSSSMKEWQLVFQKDLTATELRANYITTLGVFLEAVGLVGNYLFLNHQKDWKKYVRSLAKLDWSRNNSSDWTGRAFTQTGKITKNKDTIQLTANLIKLKLGLPLLEHEQFVENKHKVGEMNASQNAR